MANPNTLHEPSMEEILASIRQIISEDGGSAAAPRIDGVRIDAAEATAKQTPEGRDPDHVEGSADAAADTAVDEESTSEAPFRGSLYADERHAEPAPARAARLDQPLLSLETGRAVSGAFGALAETMLSQNSRTLEDVVVEMLEPMLKQWLDDNLPSIVERKVQEEIERVSRGRR